MAGLPQPPSNTDQGIDRLPTNPARAHELVGKCASAAPRTLVAQLAKQVRAMETSSRREHDGSIVSCGCSAMDSLLPAGGYPLGTVVEYLRSTPACGATYLAMAAAASALSTRSGYVLIIDRHRRFYPPAWLAHQIDLRRLIWIYPADERDALWALDQALRSPAVVASVAEVEKLDGRAARRLQLAAEEGGGIGLLLRSAVARRQPSWAEVQWLVRSPRQHPGTVGMHRGRRLHVQLVRCRGGTSGVHLDITIDGVSGQIRGELQESPADRGDRREQPSPVHLASQLAHPTDHGRRSTAG